MRIFKKKEVPTLAPDPAKRAPLYAIVDKTDSRLATFRFDLNFRANDLYITNTHEYDLYQFDSENKEWEQIDWPKRKPWKIRVQGPAGSSKEYVYESEEEMNKAINSWLDPSIVTILEEGNL